MQYWLDKPAPADRPPIEVQSIGELVRRCEIDTTKSAARCVHDRLWGPFPDANDSFYAELDLACEDSTPQERIEFIMMTCTLSL